MSIHTLPIRIYYEDTDFSGNVYHAAYLKFFERGRTEFLRDLGVHHAELAEKDIAFAVRSMQIDFLAAAKIDDLLVVETSVAELKGIRLTLKQTIMREQTVLTTAMVMVVAIHISGGPARLPPALKARLTGS